ncbi:uncharacterized protein BHQ10_006720 [Talaromyces amestolkiae]|uniref:Zn(2)-C6 fungal-type domain-containing protein n=1 Tax=Talaromyces amestolkiae TaxID=1196081 RepID=A0A364L4H2_TALAM|nr:uncharacterized protein BHQ10_006720 [Talaromyces amestolkiae]RAO70708.1 hypothetical protein BHQ10_006720 [Talaromyces amestolkiae]
MSEQDPSSKRQRINQACDQCRKRKSKCDGAQPTCSTCDNLGKVCTYGTPVKKRGLPTGYVRGIEALLGLFQQFLPNGEYTLRKILRENIAGRIVDSEYLDNASDIWRSSDLAKDFDQLLSSVDNNIGSRLTSETVQLPELRNVDTIIHQQPGEVNLFERLKYCADLPPPDYPPNIQEIVDFYFQTTHCWFPIVERRMILKALYRDDTGNNAERDSDNYSLCLWAIVGYTSAIASDQFARFDAIHLNSIQTYPQTPVSDRNLTTNLPPDDTTVERDDLDIIFEDIAAMVLPRRYDGEIADFAQNLGFLSNDLNFDSMAFQGTQGGS